jgi:hypothetical protein
MGQSYGAVLLFNSAFKGGLIIWKDALWTPRLTLSPPLVIIISFIYQVVEELFLDRACVGKNCYCFWRIASSRRPNLTMWWDRGKRCRFGFLRCGGVSLLRWPSIEGQSLNHTPLGRVEVFLCLALSTVKWTRRSPVNGGRGKVSRWTVEKPLGKFQKQEFWMPDSSKELLHRIVWFSVWSFLDLGATFSS